MMAILKKKFKHRDFYNKKSLPAHNFPELLFSIILVFIILLSSFFIPDIKSIFAEEDYSGILVCIDPGHGGKDTGTIGPTGLREKDANLDISIRLKNKLVNAGFRVIMTRESDVNHSIEEIANFANSNNADIFISVHNNSHPSSSMNGTQSFYYNQSYDGSLLANCLNTKTIEQIGTVNRGVKSSSFKVLRLTKMVSALVEGVFMCNPDEEAKLKDPNFRDRIATGIYNGILEYLKKYGGSIQGDRKLASAQSFIKRVYHRSLNMDPDAATLNDWAGKLADGKISHADVIRNVITGSQFNGRNLTDAQYVNVLYNVVLDRSPDSIGEAYWLNQLKIYGRGAALNGFLTSVEFTGLINQYKLHGCNYTGTVESAATGASVSGSNVSGTETVYNISVLNGVGIKGIAARTSGLFKEIRYSSGQDKYKIYVVADANNYNYGSTQIICKSKDAGIMKSAEEIKTILNTGIITIQNGTTQISDILIIIGKDYLATAGGSTGSGTSNNNPELIFINILNGKGAPGIAARLKSRIKTDFCENEAGIRVAEAKNADSFNYKNTRIIIYTTKPGIENIANDLKDFIGVGEVIKSTGNSGNADITVILGSDYKK